MSRPFSQIQAILFAIAGFTLWVLTDGCIKLAAGASIPPPEVAGIFGVVGMATLLIKVQGRGGVRSLRPKKWRGQIASASLSLAINLLNVIALKHLPFTVFYVTVFTAPMVVSLLAAGILGEHLTRGKIIAIIVGFIGVVIAIDPVNKGGSDMHGDWLGYVTVAASILCFAANMIILRRVTQTETHDSLAFFQAFAQSIGCGVLLIFIHVPLGLTLFLLLCGGGILNIVGNICNMIAMKHTTAATVSQFHYTQIISGALIGYLVWHEVPTLPLLAGSAIIIASGVYIANHMRKMKNPPVVKPL